MATMGPLRSPRLRAAGPGPRAHGFRPVAAWLWLAALAASAGAHDVWLEPASFRPRPGQVVGIQVMVGEAFRGEAVPRRPARIGAFWIDDGDRREPVRGVDGAAPAGLVRLADGASGWHTVLYESLPATVELPRDRFVDHLRGEGLDGLADSIGAGGPVVRETYARCSVSLLAVGPAGSRSSARAPARPTGCPVVLWPTSASHAPGPLRLELTFEGRPVAGVLVRAYRGGLRGDAGGPVEGRTDDSGTVTLDLAAAGAWMLKALVVERPAAGEAGWRSWWASLTLSLEGS